MDSPEIFAFLLRAANSAPSRFVKRTDRVPINRKRSLTPRSTQRRGK